MTLVLNSELSLWHKIFPLCKIVFDVGVRNDTTIMGLFPDITFHVFEPNPASYQSLMKNLKNASNVIANNLALGNITGKLLYYSDTESIARRTHHTTSKAIPYEINVVRLDDYCEKNQISQIDFLKIDTEGFELEVMKGGSTVISNSCRYIQFEYGGTFLDMDITLQDIYNFLEGWKIYRITNTGVDFAPTAQEDFQFCNYLAIRDGIHDPFISQKFAQHADNKNKTNTKKSQNASPHNGEGAAITASNYFLEFQNTKSPDGFLKPEFLKTISLLFDLDNFIETGTFMGDTSSIASSIFTTVHTIELSKELYQKASKRFEDCTNIRVYQGDSARLFPQILGGLTGNNLFWLDGHFSEGITAKGEENTPIIQELKAIRDSGIKNSVILVDDLRLFDKPWEHIPHDSAARGYPEIGTLCEAILDIDQSYQFAVLADVLMAFPEQKTVKCSPVLAACTLSRLFEGSNYPLSDVMKAEETSITSSANEEFKTLQTLYLQYIGSEGFGYGRHYRLWRGLTDVDKKRYDKACKEFMIAINLGFEHWRVRWYLAKAAYEAALYTLAGKSIAAVLNAVPEFQEALQLKKQLDESLLKKNPEQSFSIKDHLEIAAHLQRAGRAGDANYELASIILRPEQASDIHYQYARLLLETGQQEAARLHLHKLVEMNPQLSDAHNDLGYLYYQMNDHGKAMEYFGQALSINSLNYRAIKNVLALSSQMGISKDALPLLTELMEKHPYDTMLMGIAQEFINEQHTRRTTQRFEKFAGSIHPLTINRHDNLLMWAEASESQAVEIETPDLFERSDDPLVKNGYVLAQQVKHLYKNRFSSFKNLKILIQVPPLNVSPGGYSLFTNMLQALVFSGIQAKAMGWDEPIDRYLTEFKPTVFMTSDHQMYLSRINWTAIDRYRKDHLLRIGLTASLEEYGNTPLSGRISWAKNHSIDFFFSFRSPEYFNQRKEYRPFFENGFKIFSIEFGANPLIHYPVPNISKDIDYIFLASSNADKWPRYFSYLASIVTQHAGFIDGPGWGFQKQSMTLNKDRYLYARSRIGLNLHLTEQIEWPCELNERTYILAACGVPQLIDNPQLLPRRFDENGFFIAPTPKVYTEYFEAMLHDPQEAVKRALIAQREVFQSHTWFHRVEGLILNLVQEFFQKTAHGLIYGSDLYDKVNSNIRGKVGRIGGSVGQLIRYDQCEVEDINLQDGGYGRADEKSIIIDMHDAHDNASLANKYDCLISSNVIEHSYNPLYLLLNYYLVTKEGGYQFHAIPNHRYTYDVYRQPTTLEHFLEDFEKMVDQSDLTHKDDYIQSAIVKHGWQRDFHAKYPVSFPYMHNHVFDEYNTKELFEYMFQEVTVDLLRTVHFSDNVVMFRNSLNPAFVQRYRGLINTYSAAFLSRTNHLPPERTNDMTNILRGNREQSAMINDNKNVDSLSEIRNLHIWNDGCRLRLHLGCGEQHLDGYVNIDQPPSEHTVQNKIAADWYADITLLCFPDKSVDEIRLHHVFEHFNRSVALAMLISWHRWLKSDGVLHIETPDLIGSAKTLLSDASWSTKMSVVRHIAGSHEAAWAYHIDQWFPERFERTLTKLGYGIVDITSASWAKDPYLSNVSVIARKLGEVPLDKLIQSGDEILWESTVSPAEKAMHEVWKKELRISLRCRDEEASAVREDFNTGSKENDLAGDGQGILVLIFSKDRALQLDCTLRSFFKHCNNPEEVRLTVLYKASTSAQEGQYRILQKEYATVAFIAEVDFKVDVLSLLHSVSSVLFLVDDSIFVSDFFIKEIMSCLLRHPDVLGFSLRLGRNTTYCYMQNKNQKVPDFIPVGKGILKYNWTDQELDFGYPLEVSSSLYSLEDIIPILKKGDFRNPNTLEVLLDANKSSFINTKKKLLCFETSAAFCNPVNMVQNLWNNKAGHNDRYTPDALADLFEKGYRIDLEKFSGFIPNSCHQEVAFQFIEPSSQLTRQSSGDPLVSIIILSYNGLDHIRACLESIRRNTHQTYEIIVVDNAKQDGSLEYLRTVTDIVLIEHPENVGPAVSRAQAMAIARGDYIAFLDDDTLVTQDWLLKFISIAEKHPEIKMIGPVSNYASGLQIAKNGSYGTIEELDKTARDHYQNHRGEFTLVTRLVSFCLFITRSVVEKIGTFDSRFGLFGFEDDDYTLRAYLAGLNPTIAHEIFIHHTGGPQGRGNVVYNDRLQKAWAIYKEKWGIDPQIEYGRPYDSTPIITQLFDRNKHFVPLPDKIKITPLIYQNQTGSSGNDDRPIRKKSPIPSGLTSIIIPVNHFNGRVRRCLESIETQIKEPHEIILAELGVLSKPAWLDHCVKKSTPLKRSGVSKNSNYAVRLNEALEKITGQQVLILDPDSVVLEGAFGRMVESLNRNLKYGIVVPMLNQAMGSQQVPGAQPLSFNEFNDYAPTFGRRNRHRLAITFEIEHSCVLIKREVIEAVGPFNQEIQPSFFVLNDYRLRALVIGYQTIITADTCMFIDRDDPKRMGSDKVFHDRWDIFDPHSETGKKLSPYVSMKNARDEYGKGRFDESVQAVIEGIKITSDDEELYHCLAEILLEEKSYQDAIETLQAMPEAGKDKARTLELLGYCHLYLGHLEEAEIFGNRAVSLSGNSSGVLNLKGLIALKREDRIGAEKLFYQAIELNPWVADPYVNLGVMKWHNNEKEEGLDLIERGFILSPETGDFSVTYQSAITSLNQYSRAETVVREALGLFPNNKNLSFNLIDILLQQQKHPEAMKEIEKALLAFGINEAILSAANAVREKIGPLTIDQNKKGTGTLSICMIVKNEATDMARCLASLKPVADEIIVVDTGSTDQTKGIAAAFGAQVFDVPWNNDFSEARNISLGKAKGDWILVHDADEVLSPLDYKKFRQLIRQKHAKPIAYDLITRNYIMEPAIDGWTANIGEYRKEESGSGWFPSNKVRLFKNDPRIRFCNPVHEILEISIKRAGIDIKRCSIPIHHYGKLPTKINEKKRDIYYLLGKRKLELMGNVPIAHREMAIQAEELGKHEEAITHWQAYARAIPDNALAHFNMASIYFEMGEFSRALEMAEKALIIDPQAKETILTYATVSLCAGDPVEAEKKLEGLLERVTNYPPAQVALAASYCITGKKEEGVTLMKKMKRKGYNYDPAMESLSKKLLSAGRTELAMNLLESMLVWDAEKQKTLALLEECRAASECSPA